MITPIDIGSKEFKKTALGYSPEEVEKFLNEILADYEALYKENIELKDKVTMLNEGIHHYKALEQMIQNTMVTAEKSAEEVRNAARKKAEAIISEAERHSGEMTYVANTRLQEANYQVMKIKNEHDNIKLKIKLMLTNQLEFLETNHPEQSEESDGN